MGFYHRLLKARIYLRGSYADTAKRYCADRLFLTAHRYSQSLHQADDYEPRFIHKDDMS